MVAPRSRTSALQPNPPLRLHHCQQLAADLPVTSHYSSPYRLLHTGLARVRHTGSHLGGFTGRSGRPYRDDGRRSRCSRARGLRRLVSILFELPPRGHTYQPMGRSVLEKPHWFNSGRHSWETQRENTLNEKFQIGGGEPQRLLNVIRFQFGMVPKEVVLARIESHSLHHSAHRHPYPADARLTVHLVRVPRYAIETLHRSYFGIFRSEDVRPFLTRQTPVTKIFKNLQPTILTT